MPLRLTIRPAGATTPDASPGRDTEGRDITAAELVFDRDTVSLGRAPNADVRLPGAAVSLLHARLERSGADWFAVDGGSTNGTRLNGARLQAGQRRLVRSGDTLEVPGFVLGVSVTEAGPVSAPEATHEVARRMVREVLQALGGGGDSAPLLRIGSGPQAGQQLVLADLGRAYVIGRAAGCALRLDDRDVSREHATVRRDYAGVTLLDLGAKNGVLAGGQRLAGPYQLTDGDEIVVGATAIRFVDPAEAYLRELESRPDLAPSAAPVAPSPAALSLSPAQPLAVPAPSAPDPAGAPADALEPAATAVDRPPAPRRLGVLLLVLFAVVVALGAVAALWVLVRS
ncbi:MAG: FHA domain-containing protein [Deltaproteobacteria bacterium]|nr:FHA domain-containing protein [Deltaproteobacteria bacterium]